MAIVKAACPYCGAETNVSAAEDSTFKGVVKDLSDVPVSWTSTDAGCSECGSEFVGMFK